MTMIREKIPQDEWEYFNSLNIQFEGKHITADKYSRWVIDRDREIIFTNLQLAGRDYGDSYILILGKERVYIYVESRPTRLCDGSHELRWFIESIKAPMALRYRRDEIIELIKEIAEVKHEGVTGGSFAILKIAEPQFVEGT